MRRFLAAIALALTLPATGMAATIVTTQTQSLTGAPPPDGRLFFTPFGGPQASLLSVGINVVSEYKFTVSGTNTNTGGNPIQICNGYSVGFTTAIFTRSFGLANAAGAGCTEALPPGQSGTRDITVNPSANYSVTGARDLALFLSSASSAVDIGQFLRFDRPPTWSPGFTTVTLSYTSEGPTAIPAPAGLLVFALGLAGLGLARCRAAR